jgi:galactokinase
VDSGETHDLTTEYNDRRASCERVAAALSALEPGVKALRDVSLAMLEKHALTAGADLPFARHVVEENARVAEAEALLAKGDVAGFGKLLFASHESSIRNFQNSSEALDRLISLAKADPRCLGARLSGGGFGGVTIHLVRAADAEAYARDLAAAANELDGHLHWSTLAEIGDGPAVSVHPPGEAKGSARLASSSSQAG